MLKRLYWSAYLAYHLRGQARYPFKPLENIQRDQADRVRAIVAYAYRHVPYYRETMKRLGLQPSDIQNVNDLEKFPVIERESLQRDPEYFVSTARPLGEYLRLRSGGSSGAPRSVYYDARALFQNAAHGERERTIITAIIGRPVGYRETVFASPLSTDHEVQSFCSERGLFPRGVRIERQYLSLTAPPETNVPLLDGFKPDIIRSYGSYLMMLFPYLHDTRRPFHRPKVVSYSSDDLSDTVRHLINQEFSIPVFSTYEAIEAFKIGFECERHLGLHLNIDLYPVRIADEAGRTVAAGESGDVIVSNLVNYATVLLNYRLGDLAACLPQACACGRTLPLLSFPQGRSDDWIELEGGQLIHPQSVRTIFTDENQIWQYQVVQLTTRHFRVAIVAAPDCDREQMQARIKAKFVQRFGDAVSVTVTSEHSIDHTAGRKFRTVVSLQTRPVQEQAYVDEGEQLN